MAHNFFNKTRFSTHSLEANEPKIQSEAATELSNFNAYH